MPSKHTDSAAPQGKTHVQTIIWLARDKRDDSQCRDTVRAHRAPSCSD